MRETSFIAELEARAIIQKKLVETEMMPVWAKGVGDWLVVNPWRVIVPMSAVVYSVARIGYGLGLRDFILSIFGGF